jgi:hypothetical protein
MIREAVIVLVLASSTGVLSGCGRTPNPTSRVASGVAADQREWDDLTQRQREERIARTTVAAKGGTFTVIKAPLTGERIPMLSFRGCVGFTDRDLAEVADLPDFDDAGDGEWPGFDRIKALDLSGTAVTDAGLVHVRRANYLLLLDLRGVQITDAGFSQLLKFIPLLKTLKLGFTKVVKDGREVVVRSRGVTDDGLKALGVMDFIEDVWLADVPATDATLEVLGGRRGLKTLQLVDTKITDAGLAYLGGLDRLFLLDLSPSGITDEGLEKISTIPGLRLAGHPFNGRTRAPEVYLTGSRATPAGVDRLRGLIPAAKIDYKPAAPIP